MEISDDPNGREKAPIEPNSPPAGNRAGRYQADGVDATSKPQDGSFEGIEPLIDLNEEETREMPPSGLQFTPLQRVAAIAAAMMFAAFVIFVGLG